MAKHKYKRGFRIEKPCARCGKVMRLKPSVMDSKVYCSKACYQFRVERSCAECGKAFSLVPSQAREASGLCCSRICANKQKARARGMKIKPMQAFCLQCAVEFRPNPRTTNAGKFCSRTCAFVHKGNAARLVAWVRSLGDENRARRDRWEKEHRWNYVFQGPVRPTAGPGSIAKCHECRTEFVRSLLWQRHCSSTCEVAVADRAAERKRQEMKKHRKTASGRAHKKLYKTRRRRRELSDYEAVDPIAVFERDRWICQICRIKTPKALRGTNGPNAPELDHIIPLAKGGSHTWANLQCACRQCNGLKGDKPLGQLMLAGVA